MFIIAHNPTILSVPILAKIISAILNLHGRGSDMEQLTLYTGSCFLDVFFIFTKLFIQIKDTVSYLTIAELQDKKKSRDGRVICSGVLLFVSQILSRFDLT